MAERERLPKIVRVLGGLLLMVAFVCICLFVITRYAGYWGVPMFSFQTENGSQCTNTFNGHTCDKVTLADVELYGEIDVPDDTLVVKGSYSVTHDYALDVTLEVPKASADAALKALNGSFGACGDHHTALDPEGLANLCSMSNENVFGSKDERNQTRTFNVGTGVRKDGTRVIALSVKSR